MVDRIIAGCNAIFNEKRIARLSAEVDPYSSL